jgi:hypothetical protein
MRVLVAGPSTPCKRTEAAMPVCDVCGNDYANAFQVITSNGARFTFDSLECAAHRIAPLCAHCGCRVLGHGIETPKGIYCCANCTRQVGSSGAVDNTTSAAAP